MGQVNDGIGDSIGIDIKSMIAGILGGKVASGKQITEADVKAAVEEAMAKKSLPTPKAPKTPKAPPVKEDAQGTKENKKSE